MKKTFLKWVNTPAFWYEFWLPQSGIAGGTIAISLLTLLAYGVCYV